jgi:hypothetical protein
MREVFLSNHLKKEARKSLVICVGAVGFAFALLAIGAVTGIVLLTVLGTVALVTSGFIITKHGRMYVTYRCGIQGERVLRDHLRSFGLNDEHTAYYNLPTNGNGRITDIDCVLVGPFGVFVFEAKHHRGLVFCRNGIWMQIKVGRRGSPYAGHLGDPSVQLSRNIGRLRALFRQADLGAVWCKGAIVFTNLRAVLDIEGLRWIEAVSVKDLDRIVSKRIALSTDQVGRINTCLAASQK